ncbi:MAG: hypothetical protein ABIJ61_11965, partial [bacterium]
MVGRAELRPLLLCSVLALALLPNLASAVTLTIEQAVGMALERNEDFLVVKTELDKADAEVKNAVAG